jgi:hypothetical protein
VASFRGLDVPKTSPQSVASAIFDGMDQEEEDIFPDPMSAGIAEAWRTGAVKAMQRQFAAYTPENVAKAAAGTQ